MLIALALAPIATLTACSAGDGTVVTLASLTASPVSAATSHDTSAQSGSGAPGVDVAFSGSVPANPQPGQCPLLADDLVATFDGAPMEIANRGGYDDTGWGDSGCDGFDLRLDNATPHAGESTIVIHDATATWTIAGNDLLTDDLALVTAVAPGTSATVTWRSAPSIDTAYAQLTSGPNGNDVQSETPTTAGDAITIAITAATPGSATLTINAERTAPPTHCDGPSSCTIGVLAGADFAVTVP